MGLISRQRTLCRRAKQVVKQSAFIEEEEEKKMEENKFKKEKNVASLIFLHIKPKRKLRPSFKRIQDTVGAERDKKKEEGRRNEKLMALLFSVVLLTYIEKKVNKETKILYKKKRRK